MLTLGHLAQGRERRRAHSYLLMWLEVRITCVSGAGTRQEGVCTCGHADEVMTSGVGTSAEGEEAQELEMDTRTSGAGRLVPGGAGMPRWGQVRGSWSRVVEGQQSLVSQEPVPGGRVRGRDVGMGVVGTDAG